MDFSQAWLPYLKALSLLDGQEYDDMQRIVDSIKVPAARTCHVEDRQQIHIFVHANPQPSPRGMRLRMACWQRVLFFGLI